MFRFGDWMFDFSVMRGWHITGAFVDISIDRDGEIVGELHNRNKLNRLQAERIEHLIIHDEIKEAYYNYLAEKELLDV